MHAAFLLTTAMLAAFAVRLAMPIVKGPYAAASSYAALSAGPWRNLDFLPAVKGTDSADGLVPYIWIQPRNLVCNAWYLYLRDGQALLQQTAPHERVLSMDYMNPFPYLIGRPAPRGDNLYWSFDRNVKPETAPAAAALFAEADLVLVPKRELFNRSSSLKLQIYRSWIDENYDVIGSNEWWTCHRRRAASASHASTAP